MNKHSLLLRTGIIATIVTALCCFTPILVILLSTVGLSALTGYLDIVLLPALAFFIGLTGYAIYRQRTAKRNNAGCDTDLKNDGESHE